MFGKKVSKKEKSKINELKAFHISEKDKKDLVKNLYQILPSNSSDLQDFYKTLEILDSGYMSERKKKH